MFTFSMCALLQYCTLARSILFPIFLPAVSPVWFCVKSVHIFSTHHQSFRVTKRSGRGTVLPRPLSSSSSSSSSSSWMVQWWRIEEPARELAS